MFGSKIAGRPARQSLGSAWVLVLCRVARAGDVSGEKVSGEKTKTSGEGGVEPGTSWFQSACALAALANSAAFFDQLSSAASQRLVAVFDVLHRRRRKAINAAIEPGVEPASERRGGSVPTAPQTRRTIPERPASDLAAVVTAAMASALAKSARLCPELVYVALQRRDEVFAPFLEEFLEVSSNNRREGDEESFQPSKVGGPTRDDDAEPELRDVRVGEHARAIRRSLDSFNARVDAAMRAGRGDAPGAHWTMDKAMDVIRAACDEENRSREDRSKEDSGVGGMEPGTFGSSRVGREGEGETTTPPFDAYASETFVYREEIDAHEFFRPVVDLALSGR